MAGVAALCAHWPLLTDQKRSSIIAGSAKRTSCTTSSTGIRWPRRKRSPLAARFCSTRVFVVLEGIKSIFAVDTFIQALIAWGCPIADQDACDDQGASYQHRTRQLLTEQQCAQQNGG